MIGRRATVGLSLLCALLFSAIAVQSASAQKGVHAVNTTAFTCVENKGELDFKDAHCDEKVTPGTGKFGHVAIANDTTTELEITNEKTSDDTTKSTSSILTSTVGGVNVEITCEVVSTPANKSFIHNVEISEKKHTVTGTVLVNFEKCKVLKPANCTVVEPIATTAEFLGVEGLDNGVTKDTMGVEFKGHGKEGAFAEITFGKDAKCALKEKTFPVTGSVIATGKPAPTKANKHSGATSIFESGNKMETLKFGGVAEAFFTGRFTTKMGGKGNPITLTTVT